MAAKPVPSAAALLAAEGFAVWALFSTLPLLADSPAIREAWNTNTYWSLGLPVLMLSVAAAGALSAESPCRLAAAAVAEHFRGMLAVHQAGTSFGLLPPTLAFIGLPMTGLLALGGAGREVRRLMQAAVNRLGAETRYATNSDGKNPSRILPSICGAARTG